MTSICSRKAQQASTERIRMRMSAASMRNAQGREWPSRCLAKRKNDWCNRPHAYFVFIFGAQCTPVCALHCCFNGKQEVKLDLYWIPFIQLIEEWITNCNNMDKYIKLCYYSLLGLLYMQNTSLLSPPVSIENWIYHGIHYNQVFHQKCTFFHQPWVEGLISEAQQIEH